MLKLFIFVILIISSYSTTSQGSEFLTTDCYESFSYPKIFLKLFHYNPTGPRYLIVDISTEINAINTSKIFLVQSKELNLKKINMPCSSNIIFTTLGIDIKEILINVNIKLSLYSEDISNIHYIFKRKFKPGGYILVDAYRNFGIEIKMINSKENFLNNTIIDAKESKLYLQSIFSNYKEICIVSENNKRFVIHPKYAQYIPNGYITRIFITFEYKTDNILLYELSAFECDGSNNYIDEPKVFIAEGIPQFNNTSSSPFLQLSMVYIKYDGNVLNSYEVPFTIPGLILNDYYASEIYPRRYSKLYLMDYDVKNILCPDGSGIEIYISEFGTIFRAQNAASVEIMPKVVQDMIIILDPLNPCG